MRYLETKRRPRIGWMAAAFALALAAAPAVGGPATAEISALLARNGPSKGTYGVAVADAVSGEVIYSRDAATPRIPASTMKILTTFAALKELGPDYRFRTEVRARAEPDGAGVLPGDLVVVGGGDPTIHGAPRSGDPDGSLERLALAVRRAGVTRIEGNLVLDDSWFDRELVGAGWPDDQLDRSYCAPVGALTVQRNCVTARAAPGGSAGAGARVSLLPPTGVFTLKNEMKTAAKPADQNVVYFVARNRNTLVARGRVFREYEAEVAVPDPTAYFGDLFHRALVRKGVALGGRVVRGPGAGDGSRVTLGAVETPLFDVLTEMNRESVNLFAECVLKTVGAVRGGVGSFESGGAVVEELTGDVGLPEGEIRAVDGSGLSRGDRVSPRALARLLVREYGRPERLRFIETLSIAGYDGTLEKRMSDLGADVRAKTGTIHGVSALAGYVRAKSGRVLAFAMLMNDPKKYASSCRKVQDAICRILHEEY